MATDIEDEEEFYWRSNPQYTERPLVLDVEGSPFERVVLKSGKVQWRPSPATFWRYQDLSRLITPTDREAVAALKVISRVDQSFPPDWDPTPYPLTTADAIQALNDFVIPFVRRLIEPRPVNAEETASRQEAALRWIGSVLDIRNRKLSSTHKAEVQAMEIITQAETLCWKLDRLPTKSEIRDAILGKRDPFGSPDPPEDFDLAPDTWRRRFQAAGLANLLQGRGY